MRFESNSDLLREEEAIKTFVSIFNGSYEKLGDNDVDYKVYDKSGKLISYVEIKGRLKNHSEAYPLPVANRKLVKLADKRVNPVIIWSCYDGIIYSKVKELKGTTMWGGRKPRKGSTNDQELMTYFGRADNLKYVKFKK